VKRALVMTTFLFVIASCVSVKEVEIEPEKGGVISEQPARDPKAREQSMQLMRANCGKKKPKIVKEGHVKVGEETSGRQDSTPTTSKQTNLFTGKSSTVTKQSTTSSSTTKELTEWRIVYTCI
jgi:hypothetical protein